MNKIADILTAGVSRACDTLFVQNPRGTSLGAFCGVAVDGLIRIFTPTFNRLRDWIDIDRINTFHLIAIGIFVFNIRQLFQRRRLPDSVEDALAAIKLMESQGASPMQIKMNYISVCNALIDRVAFEQSPSEDSDIRQRLRH